ncbi:unnamed protein product [Timema podura]|uniref:Uncharacterized protein n=1 Tax=Timema podura TaxID=61482 RepID=A0ABN7P244_TIMPD|nr:unnamed protein product [Timema podura]
MEEQAVGNMKTEPPQDNEIIVVKKEPVIIESEMEPKPLEYVDVKVKSEVLENYESEAPSGSLSTNQEDEVQCILKILLAAEV